MNYRLLFLTMGVQSTNPRECPRSLGSFRQILIALQPNRNPNLAFNLVRATIHGGHYRTHDSQDASPATYRHGAAQRNLRGHPQRKLDFEVFHQRSVSEQEHSARTDVLREPDSFDWARWLTEGNWQKIRKSLSDTAFNLDWRSGHESLPWPESPRKLQISYSSPPAAVREAIKAFLQEKFSNCRFVVLVLQTGFAPP